MAPPRPPSKRAAALAGRSRTNNVYNNEGAVEESSGSDSESPPVKRQKSMHPFFVLIFKTLTFCAAPATKQRRPILEDNDVREPSDVTGMVKQSARFSGKLSRPSCTQPILIWPPAAQLAQVIDLVTDSESDAEVPNNESPIEIPDDDESDVEVANNQSDNKSDKSFSDDESVDDEDNDAEADLPSSDDDGSDSEDDYTNNPNLAFLDIPRNEHDGSDTNSSPEDEDGSDAPPSKRRRHRM